MIKKPFNSKRQRAIAPKIRPVGNPDWYKRFRQLASLSNNRFKIKF